MNHSKIYIPDNQLTKTEEIIKETLSNYNVKKELNTLLEYLHQRYKNIKSNGIKDGFKWDSQARLYVLNETLKEGIN